MLTNFVALTAGLATTASAFNCNGNYFSFFNRGGDAMSYQRLDPALFPGTQSPHLHSFDGGNGLSASSDFASSQSSSCSTARIKSDKSLYWRPTLFWNGNGTGFYRVPEKSTKIYYKFGDGDKWANVTGFPEDFNMVAGYPMKRSAGDNPGGVRWACHQPNGGGDAIFSDGFPKGFSSCNYGFATEITFPSCWNGKLMDPKKPYDHMAYPNGYGGVGIENCPSTHRAARFPTIFIEFWYDVSSFNGKYDSNSNPWVLSNGDPTGFGFHADFLNGWEKGVLEKATAETGGCNCGCGCGQAEMEQCFGSANVNKDSDSSFKSCSASGGDAGDASRVLQTLPGCNPIQSGPASATMATGPNCAATGMPAASGGSGASGSKTADGPSVTAKPSEKASSGKADATSSKVVKDDAALPSMSFPNKNVNNEYGPTSAKASATPVAEPSQQYGGAPTGGKDAAASSPLPSLSPASSAAPGGSSGKPSGGKDGECKAPVYVTVTPTVYVTAAPNSTACGGTVTKTLTQTATVTVEAQGGVEYGSY